MRRHRLRRTNSTPVQRNGPDQLWLTDFAEQEANQGRIYLCAIKDVFSSPIASYSISSRTQARFAVDALQMAVAGRGNVAFCTVHPDQGSELRTSKLFRAWQLRIWSGRWGETARPGSMRPCSRSLRCCRRTCSTTVVLGRPEPAEDQSGDLDQANVSPMSTASLTGSLPRGLRRNHREGCSRSLTLKLMLLYVSSSSEPGPVGACEFSVWAFAAFEF
ncbi:DDE-type integrase/transposase/recombinase [Arthrobacter rhombi]|uniref:DDE-type integrase/transposase/recombinase n=1 Tax=Arthrobacter rhombi TaxID=71253 RepID=UPI003FD61CA7